MLDNLNDILCYKSTPTLRNRTCWSLLVLEQWTILIPRVFSITIFLLFIACKRVMLSVFFPYRGLRLLLSYSCCFPILSSKYQEIFQRENVLHARKYEKSTILTLSSYCRLLHKKTSFNISLLIVSLSQFHCVKKGTNDSSFPRWWYF